jgi:hypothetical protein
MEFLLKTQLIIQKVDRNIGFWEHANIFAENWRKSQKIVIITSTQGWPDEFVKKKSPKK